MENNLSLKELDEVNIQMHVAGQNAFKKNAQFSPVSGQSFVGKKDGPNEEPINNESLEAAVMQQMCPRCRLSYK